MKKPNFKQWLDSLPEDIADEVLSIENPKAVEMLIGLNPSQVKASTAVEGPIQINAVAGSGKTRVLVQRVGYMLTAKKINPANIMITSFTKKAAQELEDRLKPIVPKMKLMQMTLGTTHSIGWRILSKEYKNMGHALEHAFSYNRKEFLMGNRQKIYVDKIKQAIIRDRSIPFDMKQILRDIPVPQLIKAISTAKNKGQDNEEFAIEYSGVSDKQDVYIEVYHRYENQKWVDRLVDSDDLLFLTWKLFKENPDILEKYRKIYKYVMVDEAQDNNSLQYELFKMLAYPENNLFVVGDDDQCQPVDTQVLVEGGQYVSIQDLNPLEHKVVSYDKRASNVVGMRKGYNFDIASRPFKGELVTVEVDGKVSKSTPNHKWIVKWADNRNELYSVYLMQKGDNFRIGWCKLFKNSGEFHLGIRARNQKADKAWILYTTTDPQKASMAESIYAAKFGIPLVPFVEPASTTYYAQWVLDTIYEEVPTKEKALNLLEVMGLEYDFPMYTPELAYERKGGTSIIEVHACNLIGKYMTIPSHKGGKIVEWHPVKVGREEYDGLVYSLDVDTHELYISDGLVTHNSMYGFRGARPDQFIYFNRNYKGTQQIALEDNYRSNPHILEVANNLIANNKVRLVKKLKANKKHDGESVFFHGYKTEEEEATGIVESIGIRVDKDDVQPKDIAILYRTNAQSRSIEDSLIIAGIPYVIHGGISFYERKEVKDLVAYMQLALNPHNDSAFDRVVNTPSRYLGKAFKEKVKSYNGSHWDAIDGNIYMKDYEKRGTGEFKTVVNTLKTMLESDATPVEMVEFMMEDFYEQHLKDEGEDEEDGSSRFENINTLKFALEQYEKVEDFLDYMDKMTSTAKHSVDGVQVMTIHKSKGLEFPYVYIIGASQGLIPHFKSIEAHKNGNTGAIEEERRLMYVAITRAETECVISSTGKFNGKVAPISMFIKELGLNLDNRKIKELNEEAMLTSDPEEMLADIIDDCPDEDTAISLMDDFLEKENVERRYRELVLEPIANEQKKIVNDALNDDRIDQPTGKTTLICKNCIHPYKTIDTWHNNPQPEVVTGLCEHCEEDEKHG